MFDWLKKKNKKKKENGLTDIITSKNDYLPLFNNIDKNLEIIYDSIGHNHDVKIREFKINNSKLKAAVIYVEGLVDETQVNEQILKSMMLDSFEISLDHNIVNKIKERIVTICDANEIKTLNNSIYNILSGSTVLLIDHSNLALSLSTQAWEARDVVESSSEPTVRGPKDSFTETLKTNIVHLRRRIKDPNFTLDKFNVGRRSRTDLVVAYINDIANDEIVREVKKRIEKIDIDSTLSSGYIEQLIEDNFLSPFPQVLSTERPDKVVAALMEGRVAILLDTDPFALIVPANMYMFIQAPEDYYERWIYASLVRSLRYIIIFMALSLPSLYIALISYHQGLIPTKLAISIAASREGVPFPSLIEALIMESTLEILREAGVRLPKPIGQAVGIVGGLVIGEAAVSAGIVSPIMVVAVALTAISSFAIPQYGLGITFRMLRFVMMIAAGFLGLYGVMLIYILISVHLVKLKSFGIEYTSPLVPYRLRDWKDSIIRKPMMSMKNRPEMLKPKDLKRKGD